MCGALTYRQSNYNFADILPSDEDHDMVSRSANADIRPTMAVPVIHNKDDGSRLLEFLRWGRQTPRLPKPLINARAETIDEKPTFKTAFKDRRCIVAADGWYEWVDVGKPKKQRMFYEFPDRHVFYLAAIQGNGYHKRPKQDKWEHAQAVIIVTTEASKAVYDSGHHRQPVMLDATNAKLWLDRGYQDAKQLLGTKSYEGLKISAVDSPVAF
jgi:putative SOS response-associated peptidase YedK